MKYWKDRHDVLLYSHSICHWCERILDASGKYRMSGRTRKMILVERGKIMKCVGLIPSDVNFGFREHAYARMLKILKSLGTIVHHINFDPRTKKKARKDISFLCSIAKNETIRIYDVVVEETNRKKGGEESI